MTYHIFTRGSDLFVITEKLPEQPPIYFGPHPKVDAYHAELSRLKENAVRVGNRVVVRNNDTYQIITDGHPAASFEIPKEKLKEGELYPIECEISYECCFGSDDVNCSGPHCNTHPDFRAILKPPPPPVKEETQDELWKDIDYTIACSQFGYDRDGLTEAINELKSKYRITRL